eukprot:gb/GECG01013677.1/.p1 GENE.gb/GECG01013677.1/~~gb/GECG01013677.1/.p1  ORF type:complete len:172 (+),score=10.51 gb/GECG01013677.1/:1-516(+)
MMEDADFKESVKASLLRKYQHILDQTTIYRTPRWLCLLGLLALFAYRIYALEGFFIVAYGLGIYLLNNFLGFLSPQTDPETAGPILPTRNSEEYRPFQRQIPEFSFWLRGMKAILVCMCMTLFSVFDIPVFWPVLVAYFLVLFGFTMKKQIAHMIRYRYLPFDWGKKKYMG